MRAQAGVEAIAVIGISLLLLLCFFVLASELLSNLNSRQSYLDAERSVGALASAADSVYAQGEGASETVSFTLPANTVFGGSKTYIGRPESQPNVPKNTVNINVDGTDMFAISQAPLSGTLPQSPGTYSLKVISRGQTVEIFPLLAELGKNSVYLRMASNETRSASVPIRAASSESLSASISFPWPHTGVAAASSLSSSTIGFDGGSAILNFTSLPNASGIYSSTLSIIVTGQASGATETFTVPVTIFVSG
ncbi:MAG: hypothetical protein NT051_06755 [Candidatus Micrarchaeota archaeon]|nr:hypothetical protein [Candidatus Micrarchaeota archaeon]